jgi:Fic family protein
LGYEERQWTAVPRADYGAGATRTRSTDGKYRSAVPPLIARLTPVPTTAVAELAERATIELSRFDAELGERVAAFAPMLLRSEAASSSRIENLTANARAIFTADLGAKTAAHAMEIAANTRAMQAAIDLSGDVSAAAISTMHAVLMEGQARHTPGQWRNEQVWIGTSGESPVGATYVAPAEGRVPDLIDDLVVFAARTDVPSLSQIAVAHAQFETIHPFTDGNGRTGRALAQALLRYRGVTRNVAVPVSAGLLSNVSAYHDALTEYRGGDVSPIIYAFADASLKAIENARRLLKDIDEVVQQWHATVKARSSSNVWPLLDIIARRPVLDAATAARELGVQTPNVYPPLRALVEQGILKSKAEHLAGPFWRSDEILSVIDKFAERAGRRSAS